MKTTYWPILTLLLLITFAGCQHERLLPNTDGTEHPESKVRLHIYTHIPSMEKPIVRNGMAQEDHMTAGNFWIFVFDNTGTPSEPAHIKLLEIAQAEATASTGMGGYKWSTTLKTRNHPVKVLLIANTPTLTYNANALNATLITPTAFAVNTTYADVLAQLYTAKLNSWLTVVPYTPNLSIPMSKVIHLADLSAQTHMGTEDSPLQLLRVVAKVTIDNATAATNPDFVLLSANLHNAPANSNLIEQNILSNATSLTKYEGVAGQETSAIATAVAPTPSVTGIKQSTAPHPLYCYEANDNDIKNIFLIVQGTYRGAITYYKINIAQTTSGNALRHIQRNMHYRVVIQECAAAGSISYAEAVAAPPSNIIYHVEVTDLSSHDIIDNGQYYIGLSNSEYHFWATPDYAPLPIATLHTGTNFGAVAPSGDVYITSSSPELTVLTNRFSHPANQQIILAEATKDFLEGVVTVRLGNLTKEIKVVRQSNSFIEIKDQQIVNHTYNDPKYKVAQVNTPTPWIKLGITPSVTLENGQDKISTNESGIYIVYNTHLAQSDLESIVYISSADGKRIKAHFLLNPL